MRELATAERIREFMRRLGEAVPRETRIYLTGGATAVLIGWRETTLDVDLKIVPESDEAFRTLPVLKEALRLNVELASPDQFIPPLPGWELRSPFIVRHGRVDFLHFDLHSQALAKIERGHARDLEDVSEMLRRGLVEPAKLRGFFEQIRPGLMRYPAIDPEAFARKVGGALSGR
jgi:hypothetical protein